MSCGPVLIVLGFGCGFVERVVQSQAGLVVGAIAFAAAVIVSALLAKRECPC